MKTTGIYVFSSIGASYFSLNALFEDSQLELIEFSPLGKEAQLIVQGEDEKIQQFTRVLREADLLKTELIPDLPKVILDAYFSLVNQPILKSLLVIDDLHVGVLFRAAMECLNHEMKIVDLRLPRSTGSKPYLVVTSDDPSKAAHLRDHFHDLNLNAYLIREVSSGFRNFFDIERK